MVSVLSAAAIPAGIAGRINEAHPWRDMHHLFDCLSQANRVEDAHHLVIEMHRAGQVVGCLLALQHQRRNATLAEQIGQRCADRPVANDSDISLVFWRHFCVLHYSTVFHM